MSHSLLLPNITLSPESSFRASPFSKRAHTYPLRSISWHPFSPDTAPRMDDDEPHERARSERSHFYIPLNQARQASPSEIIPLVRIERWLPLKTYPSSDDYYETVQHLDWQHDSSENQHHPRSKPSEGELPRFRYSSEACIYSSLFPVGHHLNPDFVQVYQLEDELGSGGYGFVMTAYHRLHAHDVAVKFIIKDKVPEHAWMHDSVAGHLPAEIVLLRAIHHDNIVKCLGIFEDNLYFYLVQELHGSPWHKHHRLDSRAPGSFCPRSPISSSSTPALSPSWSEASLPTSEPTTPPHALATLQPHLDMGPIDPSFNPPRNVPKLLISRVSISRRHQRPQCIRRPSHDLFECIEQSEQKKLTEDQARHVFAQVVNAVQYLHRRGIIHRDIKDENLVIDENLTVKLIDFGSAIAIDTAQPPPYFEMFYGTAAYASSEILLRKSYQAAPAEIWTLGILLSYLLTGVSPFPTARDAVDGRIFLSEKVVGKISDDAMDLMRRCLDPNPETRASISQLGAHVWLRQGHSS